MAKIDTSDWKEFSIGSIFNVVKGTRLTKANMLPGEIRFIGSSAMNNGCTALVGNDENIHPKNTITVCYNGSVGETFYQDEPFLASDDVNVLYPKFEMNKEIALFIVPLIKAVSQKYTYIDKWKQEDMIADKIKLPVLPTGEIDWKYMEQYMQNILNEVGISIENLSQTDNRKHEVNISEWKEFVIGDLFEISRPIARSQAEYVEGNVPFVASGNYNNGIVKWCMPKEDESLDFGNCITVSPLDGSAFYQKENFLGRGGAGSAILMLRNDEITELSGLFIASVIRNALTRYSYSDQLNSQTIADEIIRLPIVKNTEKPDYTYMESYMKSMMDSAKSEIEKFESLDFSL